jgi:predicted ATPase/DNA-binding SARP family transcriptional activator
VLYRRLGVCVGELGEGLTSEPAVRLLGPIELGGPGGVVAIGGPKTRAVLALLALHAPAVVHTDQLVDAVWGEDPPSTVRNGLQVHISTLRKALRAARASDEGGELLPSRSGGYALAIDATRVDATRFEATARDAGIALARGDAEQAADLAETALGYWRGAALADLGDFPFAAPAAVALEESRLQCLEVRADAQLARGRHAELVADLEVIVAENPYRERIWARLVLALYRDGRQADALACLGRVRAILLDDLGLDPGPELAALERAVLDHDPALLGAAPTAAPVLAAPLPWPPTRLVGRDREVAELSALLREPGTRVVTVLGPGGIGKTRLALEVAHGATEAFDHPVVYLDLSTERDPGRVVPRIAQALAGHAGAGPGSAEQVAAALDGEEVLVVLDNFEQVVAAATDLARFVAACRPVVVLVTSRVSLSIAAEHRFPLDALEPDDAVQLFVQRARAVGASIALAEDDPNLQQLCQQLDNLPLAIELAAARTRVMPVGILVDRIGREALGLSGGRDAPERQRSLRHTIAWSVSLLSEVAQRLFPMLALFEGGFTLGAVETVGSSAGIDVLDAMAELIDTSLVTAPNAVETVATGAVPRFRLLETVRAFAAERLIEAGALYAAADAHASYYAARAEADRDVLLSLDVAAIIGEFQRDLPNLRVATRRLLQTDPDRAARVAVLVGIAAFSPIDRADARNVLESCLTMEGASRLSRAEMLSVLGRLEYMQRSERAVALLEESIALFRTEGLGNVLAVWALGNLGGWLADHGDFERGAEIAEEGIAAARVEGSGRALSSALVIASYIARGRCDWQPAVEYGREAAEIATSAGDPRIASQRMGIYASALALSGQLVESERVARTALSDARSIDDPMRDYGLYEPLVALGATLVLTGLVDDGARAADAIVILLEALEVADRFGWPPDVEVGWMALALAQDGAPASAATIWGAFEATADQVGRAAFRDEWLDGLRSQLGGKRFETLVSAGEAQTGRAVALAIDLAREHQADDSHT